MFQTQLLNAKVPIFTKVKQSYKTSNLSHSPRLAADFKSKAGKALTIIQEQFNGFKMCF